MSSYKKDSLKFDGTNFNLRKGRMKCHLRCMGVAYWTMVTTQYVPPQGGPKTQNEITDAENNLQTMEALLSSLSDSELSNVIDLPTAFEIWQKLELLHEGDKYVKSARLRSLKRKFENLKMREDENITTFMPRVNELVCGIRNVGGVLDEDEIVGKILRSLPASYKIKVAAIEEFRVHTTVTRDQLAGKLATFEITEFGDDPQD